MQPQYTLGTGTVNPGLQDVCSGELDTQCRVRAVVWSGNAGRIAFARGYIGRGEYQRRIAMLIIQQL